MAIAYDNKSGGATPSFSQSSFSWSHTCKGSDLVLVVFVFTNYYQANAATYNGVSMTKVFSSSANGSSGIVNCFILSNPATGTNTVNTTIASGVSVFVGSSISYTGCNTSDPVDVYNSNTGSSSDTPSISVTTNYDNSVILDGVGIHSSSFSITPNAGQTSLQSFTSASGMSLGSSSKPAATAGTFTLGWTKPSVNYSYGVIAIREYTQPTATGNFFQLF